MGRKPQPSNKPVPDFLVKENRGVNPRGVPYDRKINDQMESLKSVGQFAWESLPGIGTAYTIQDIKDELAKEEPNYYMIGALAGAEVIGLIPGLGDAAAELIKKGAKSAGKLGSKIDRAVDQTTALLGGPKAKDVIKNEMAGFTGQNPPTYIPKDEPVFDPDGIYETNDDDIIKFREPIAEFTRKLTMTNSFPSKGMTGAEFLRLLEKNAESIPPSSYKEGLVDKDKRYTREELLDAVTKSPAGLPESIYYNLADLEATPAYQGYQRQSEVGFTGAPTVSNSYFSIPILSRTSGNTFKANSQHFDPSTTAHVRGSFVDSMVGYDVNKTLSPRFKSIIGREDKYLLVEEIQSDLLQKGYRKPKNSFDTAFDKAANEAMIGTQTTFQEVYGDVTNELKSLIKTLEAKDIVMPEEPVRLQLPFRTGVLNHPVYKERRRRDFLDELRAPERSVVDGNLTVDFEEIKDYIDKQGVNSSHIYQILNDIELSASATRSFNPFESVSFVGPNGKVYNDIIVRRSQDSNVAPYTINQDSPAYSQFLTDFEEYTKQFGLSYEDLLDKYEDEITKFYDAIDVEIEAKNLDADLDRGFISSMYERFLEIKKDQKLLGDETNTALPPVRKNRQTVEEALKLLIAKADQEGVDKIVIPPASKIAEARGRTIDPSDKGDRFYRTYVTDLNKALEDLEKNYPVTIHRDVELPYRSQNEIDNAGQAAANAADDAAINDDFFTVEEGNEFFDLPEGFFDDVPDQQPENLVEITEPLGDELLPPSKRKKLVKVDHKGIIIDISKLREQFQVDKPRQFAEGGSIRPKLRPEGFANATSPKPRLKPSEDEVRYVDAVFRGEDGDIITSPEENNPVTMLGLTDGDTFRQYPNDLNIYGAYLKPSDTAEGGPHKSKLQELYAREKPDSPPLLINDILIAGESGVENRYTAAHEFMHRGFNVLRNNHNFDEVSERFGRATAQILFSSEDDDFLEHALVQSILEKEGKIAGIDYESKDYLKGVSKETRDKLNKSVEDIYELSNETLGEAGYQTDRDRGPTTRQGRRGAKPKSFWSFITEKLGFAEGGAVGNMNQQMSFAFEDGGLRDDGMMRDPVSGNEVPPGSTAKEVRDDIPAQLSEGEYVVPADVVRYYGVKFFEDLRDNAKMGLQDMEDRGRIGGEPVPAGGPMADDLSPEEMAAIQEMMGMAEGGVVNMYKQQQDLYTAPNPAIGNSNTNYAYGGVVGYAPGGLQAANEQSIYTAGQQAQQAGFTGFPLGSTIFPTQAQLAAGQTTPAFDPTASQDIITLYSPDGKEVRTLNLAILSDREEYSRLLSEGWSTQQLKTTTETAVGQQEGAPPYGERMSQTAAKNTFDLNAIPTDKLEQTARGMSAINNIATGIASMAGLPVAALVNTTGVAQYNDILERMDAEGIKHDLERRGSIFGGEAGLKDNLNDISGDGQINFADTWLGDALGFDGEAGVQGPTLKESWRGARRNAGPSSASSQPSSSDKSPASTPAGKYSGVKDALVDAGYTVSEDGNSVYNDQGQVAGQGWSGSSTVDAIAAEGAKDSSSGAPSSKDSGSKDSSSDAPSSTSSSTSGNDLGYAEDPDYGAVNKGGLMVTPKKKAKRQYKKGGLANKK